MASSAVNGPPARAGAAPLAKGSVVGGRFEIDRAVGDDALGTLLSARDQKTNKPISVRVLSPGLIATPEAMEILRQEVKVASSIQHKCVAATYGTGADKGGARFVATEWIDGQNLADVVRERKRDGDPMALRSVIGVLTHVCSALEVAHPVGGVHGAIRPSVVWVTSQGRVKIAGFGLERAILRTAGPAALGATEQAYLAPEVKGGGVPDARSDIFGLGALLYALLTHRSAADDFIAPSMAHPEATEVVDQILLKCLAIDPAQRYATPAEVKAALEAVPSDATEVDVDVDVDIKAPSVRPPPAQKPIPPPPKRPAPPRPAAKPDAPSVGARVPVDASFRTEIPAVVAPAAAADVDLGDLLAKITENDAPRWMVVKDNLDHGPFSGRELVQLILKGEVLGDHGLLNMDTGQRRKVKEAPEFVEFAEQYKIKKAAADHRVALEKSAVREKVGLAFYAAILGGVLAVVGGGVGIFIMTRPTEEERQQEAVAELQDLYERGEIEISGTAGILPDPAPGTRRRGGGRRRAGGGLSYEDAMNQVENLGDVSGGGSQARLSAGDVQGVMNRNVNRFLPCVAREPGIGTVRMSLAIAGDGRILGVTVASGSPAFQSCISQRAQGIRFPTFAAQRMGASYSFSVD